MDTNRQSEILAIANNNLLETFGPVKHNKPIDLNDIEAVYKRNVLSVQADAKTRKGLAKGYLTGIMYFAPAKLSGIEVCPSRSLGCTSACLFSAGRGRFYSVTRARIIKTLAYHFDTVRFIATVKKSIVKVINKANKMNMVPVIRLNGTSDILWERNTDIIQSFPDTQFYDYSKIAKRFLFNIPSNYHLTFSLSDKDSSETDAKLVLSKGGNVAAVFRKELPVSLWGYPVTNGDDTDLRFLDTKGSIVGLKAKGKAKKDTSGFVRDHGSNTERKAA